MGGVRCWIGSNDLTFSHSRRVVSVRPESKAPQWTLIYRMRRQKVSQSGVSGCTGENEFYNLPSFV